MIQFYTWKTPNGRKVAIMLAEIGLAYELRPVDLTADEQLSPAFLAISPNNKIPAIVDDDAPGGPLSLFESGAILTYLARRSGMLLNDGIEQWSVLQWLHWSIGGIGPILGQLNYFANRADERVPQAIERFSGEAIRLLGVLEGRLAGSSHIGGGEYSIADIASYPWIAEAHSVLSEPLGDTFAHSPAVMDWLQRVGERPAVQQGMAVLAD